MYALTLHSDCAPGPVRSIAAQLELTASGFTTRFLLEGDIRRIAIPAPAEPARADDLWRTTCCEVFWQQHGQSTYREFNLSPSGQWACYDFDDYRLNGRDGAVEAVTIDSRHSESELVLDCRISAELGVPALIGLTAVVEDDAGAIQYWSLSFASGKPDFHRAECRSLQLAGRL